MLLYVLSCLLTLNRIYVILLYLIGFLSLHFGPMLFVCILHLQYDCVHLESLIVVYAPMYVILCSWNGILPQSECNACNSRYMASFSVFCSLFIVMLFYVGILHLQYDCVPLESLFVVYTYVCYSLLLKWYPSPSIQILMHGIWDTWYFFLFLCSLFIVWYYMSVSCTLNTITFL